MGTVNAEPYCTETTAFVLDLLDFVEEKIAEAEASQSSRAGALLEASGALPIIKSRLLREDQTAHAQFMLLGLFEQSFERMSQAQEAHYCVEAKDLKGRIDIARQILRS